MGEFSERLRLARTLAGLTQKELGDRAKVTNQAISNYESEVTQYPKMEHAIALAHVLNVGLEELVGFTPAAEAGESGTPGEQDDDVLWAAEQEGLGPSGIKKLRKVRREIGPMDRVELLMLAVQIRRNEQAAADRRDRR